MVPFTMPMTWSMGSPSRDSRSGRTSGMPPPTAASNSTSTPDASAAAKISAPTLANSSLLAVTTGLPALRASRISWRAGSMPPMTSMTTSTSGSLTTEAASLVNRSRDRSTPRSLEALRTATRVISRRRPVRDSMPSACSWTSCTSADPTVPQPSRPTRTSGSVHAPTLVGRREHPVRDTRRAETPEPCRLCLSFSMFLVFSIASARLSVRAGRAPDGPAPPFRRSPRQEPDRSRRGRHR